MTKETDAAFTTKVLMTFRRCGGKAVFLLPGDSRAIERR